MAHAHADTQLRTCGASTIVTGQTFVKVDGLKWAVEGDKNSHGDGALIASQHYVKINGIAVILQNDSASPDDQMHANPAAQGFVSFVNVN